MSNVNANRFRRNKLSELLYTRLHPSRRLINSAAISRNDTLIALTM